MSGRGDNNKNGSAGRGASNQSNQPFGQAEEMGKSNTRKESSGKRSQPQSKEMDQDSNRNRSTNKGKS